ncbi:MaoC family dehydratase [Microbacterium sp. No. 7]|uniref:MaoC family dehydratase n=1 Tax=Microbacterium sp. No. 7 TaxID=1714373 RepID=UPI0006D2A265|nr:MaoC family dehydratase [Microbacterium sp. No. 7]ALJ19303.1 hypothetical protein AOA12_05040 [Microbacterium sp. No. 7]
MAEKRILKGAEGLAEVAGQELGVSDWLTVDQEMIDTFGRTTGDEQWIHMDPERAASGPFGGTVAHGLLALSLVSGLANQIYEVEGFSARVFYGLEKVRFPQALRSGERVHNRLSVLSVETIPAGTRVTFEHKIESESGGRPVCVAQTVIVFTQ